MNRLTEDIELNTRPYNWGRISEEAQIIKYCQEIGAVDLRETAIKPMKPVTGFAISKDE